MFGFSMKNSEIEGDIESRTEWRVLDMSQLPRLVSLRMAKAQECACDRCGDLLENLQKNESKRALP